MKKFRVDEHQKLHSGFHPSEIYFEGLRNEIIEKINEIPAKNKPVYRLTTIWYGVAAVLIVGLGVFFLNQDATVTIDEIDNQSIENYLAATSSVSSYEIIGLMDSKELDEMQVDVDIESQQLEDLLTTNPNLENYISE